MPGSQTAQGNALCPPKSQQYCFKRCITLKRTERFSKTVLGYNPEEVDAFIARTEASYEERLTQYRRLVKELEESNAKVLQELWRTKKRYENFFTALTRLASGDMKAFEGEDAEYTEVSMRALAESLKKYKGSVKEQTPPAIEPEQGTPDADARHMMQRIYGIVAGNTQEETPEPT